MPKVKAFALIVVGVFIASAAPIFIANAANIWEIPLSTWQTIISAGVAGVVAWLLATVLPTALQPSKGLQLPEA